MRNNSQPSVSGVFGFTRFWWRMNFRRRPGNFRFPTIVLLAAFFVSIPAVWAATDAVEKFSSADCLDCHTDPKNWPYLDLVDSVGVTHETWFS
jgi:hypothetical protein